ncbi:MAG: hypothetical protein H0W06_07115 [Chloroflexia bacterium]|nr:hypothetical protein [Chloroflexia bacterium]
MDSEVQIKRIVLDRMERCSICHRDFGPDDIHVISRKPDLWTMLVECDECHARNFVAAVLNDGDPEEAQVALRRLNESALKKTSAEPEIPSEVPPGGDPVTAGDVVDIHEFLRDFEGDFRAMFRG